MKRVNIMASLAVVAALALGFQGRVWADDGGSGNGGESQGATAPAMQGPNGGGGGMAEQMKEKLGLSDDQFEKFKQEQKQNRETMRPLNEKRRALIETLASQVQAKASDSDINTTLSSLESVTKDIEAARQDHVTALKSILSPTQYAQIVLAMAKSMGGERMHRQGQGQKDNGGDSQDAPPASDSNAGY